jgi:single-stranded DNA-specific DHH superfamily exonuclease
MRLENVQKFHDFLENFITIEVENSLDIDYELPSCVDLKSLADNTSMLEPFGKGMERPIFCMKNIRIEHCKPTSDEKHMIIMISNKSLTDIRSIIFNAKSKHRLVSALKNAGFTKIDIAFSIRKNKKFGPNIVIEDARVSET